MRASRRVEAGVKAENVWCATPRSRPGRGRSDDFEVAGLVGHEAVKRRAEASVIGCRDGHAERARRSTSETTNEHAPYSRARADTAA